MNASHRRERGVGLSLVLQYNSDNVSHLFFSCIYYETACIV